MVKSTQIELVLPAFFQLLDCSQNYRIFNVRAIVWRLKYPSQYDSLVFFDPPCIGVFQRCRGSRRSAARGRNGHLELAQILGCEEILTLLRYQYAISRPFNQCRIKVGAIDSAASGPFKK